MPSSKTLHRLEAQILQRAAHCLQFELADPRVGFITLTGAKLASDMSVVTLKYSVLGDQAQLTKTERMLDQARGFVQRQYASILRTRTIPSLRWEYDSSIADASRIDSVISDAIERDENIAGGQAQAAVDSKFAGSSPADAAEGEHEGGSLEPPPMADPEADH